MSEYPIPEDLKSEYERMLSVKMAIGDGGSYRTIKEDIELIERIARLESENKKLREALEARRVADEMWRDDAPHNLCHSQTKHAQELSRAALQQATGKE